MALLGIFLGFIMHHWVKQSIFLNTVNVLLMLSGLKLVYDAFIGLHLLG